MRILGKVEAYSRGRLISGGFKSLYDIRATAIAASLHPALFTSFIIAGSQSDSPEFAHAKMNMKTRSTRSSRIQNNQ
jgi:hypothetical protein